MPHPTPSAVLERLRAGHDVSSDLEILLDPANTSRADLLSLSKAVLNHLIQLPTSPRASQKTNPARRHPVPSDVDAVFSLAISSLRTLTPHLRAANADPVDAVAAIERFAIKIAVASMSRSTAATATTHSSPSVPPLFPFIFDHLCDSLHLVLAARHDCISTPPKPARRRPRTRASKENDDPQRAHSPQKTSLSPHISGLDTLFFAGASNLGMERLLPRPDDGVAVSTVIAGALAVRVVQPSLALSVSQRIVLARRIVVPWLRHLRSLDVSQSMGSADFFQDGVYRFFLNLPDSVGADAAEKCRARVFALTLRPSSLQKFSANIAKSVAILLRVESDEEDDHALMVAASIYNEACEFAAANFTGDDEDWLSEPVVAWMDHVVDVMVRQGEHPRLPPLFKKRVADLRTSGYDVAALCVELQIDMYKAGVFSLAYQLINDGTHSYADFTVWEDAKALVEKLRHNVVASEGADDWRDILRCLHVIDPCRKALQRIITADNLVPFSGAESILEVFMQFAERASHASFNKSHEKVRTAAQHPYLTINGKQCFLGESLEACRALITFRWNHKQYDLIREAIGLAEKVVLLNESSEGLYRRSDSDRNSKWIRWFSSNLCSFLREKLGEVQSSTEDQDNRARELLEICHICHDSLSVFTEFFEDLSMHWVEVLKVLRDMHLMFHEWKPAAECSVLMVGLILKNNTACPTDATELRGEVADCLAHDLVRAVRNGLELDFLVSRDIEFLRVDKQDVLPSADSLFKLLNEYSIYIRKSQDGFQTHESFLEHMDALQAGKLVLLDELDLVSPSTKPCLLRRAYSTWLHSSIKSKEGKALLQELNGRAKRICVGHDSTGLLGGDKERHDCEASTIPIVRMVVNLLRCVEEEHVQDLKALMDDLEGYIKTALLGSMSAELVAFTAEALEVTRVFFSLREYHEQAVRSAQAVRATCAWAKVSNTAEEPCDSSAEQSLILWPGSSFDMDHEAMEPQDEISSFKRSQVFHYGKGDVISAMVDAGQALKVLLRKLVSRSHRLSQKNVKGHSLSLGPAESQFVVGGVTINVDANMRFESGRHLKEQLYRLVTILFQYAQLHFIAESFRLARYYLERCYALASLCLPEDSHVKVFIASVFESLGEVQSGSDSAIVLQETLSDVDLRSGYEMGRDARSEYRMWCTMASSAQSGKEVAEAYDICEEILHNVQDREAWAKRGLRELGVLRTTSNVGSVEQRMLRELIEDDEARADLRVAGIYFAALSASKARGSTAAQRPVRRRGKARTHSQAETRTLLTLAQREIDSGFNVPWVCRRVWGLSGVKFEDSSFFLSRKCGASFDVRRRFILGARNKMNRRQTSDESTSTASEVELEQALGRANIVLVGLDLDEERENLLFWRISGDGRFCAKKALPADGEAALTGVMQRLESISKSVREGSKSTATRGTPGKSRLTNREKEAWWEERHRLDGLLEEIVYDVGEQWLGDELQLAMLPAVSDAERGDDNENSSALSVQAVQKMGEEALENSRKRAKVAGARLGQLVVLLGTALEGMPWESLPLLREYEVSVTRTPSLDFLMEHVQPEAEEVVKVHGQDVFYVVNPSGEFQKTQERFDDVIRRQDGWSGVAGKTSREEVTASYNGERTYLYCGHGSGDAFFSLRRFEKTGMAPVALLMGCSSARAERLGDDEAESNGAAVDFLLHGSPSVVGNLWDVSDGDIDRLALSMLGLWVGAGEKSRRRSSKPCNLAEAVARSRSVCRLPYLVGAACVVMGAPNVIATR